MYDRMTTDYVRLRFAVVEVRTSDARPVSNAASSGGTLASVCARAPGTTYTLTV